MAGFSSIGGNSAGGSGDTSLLSFVIEFAAMALFYFAAIFDKSATSPAVFDKGTGKTAVFDKVKNINITIKTEV